MRNGIVGLVIVAALAATAWTDAVADDFYLEMGIGRTSAQYLVHFAAGNPGAATCSITTPRGTFECIGSGGDFLPGAAYLQAHEGLSWSDLASVIATPWTMVWDGGRTTVTIDFGTVQQDDFLETPILVTPAEGVIYGDPNPFTIEWSYSVDPCDAQFETVGVQLLGPGGLVIESDDLVDDGIGCEVTTWTPPAPLAQGAWSAIVYNGFTFRDVPVGLTVVGDPWVLDNSGWLSLYSASEAGFSVPVQRMSIGAVKALFR
jgi:hypothetical protein